MFHDDRCNFFRVANKINMVTKLQTLATKISTSPEPGKNIKIVLQRDYDWPAGEVWIQTARAQTARSCVYPPS